MSDTAKVGVELDGKTQWIARVAWLPSEGRCALEWEADFLRAPLPVSPLRLPVRAGLSKADPRLFNGLFGMLNDSLPDGFGLRVMDHELAKLLPGGARSVSPVARLCWVGDSGAGALVYAPEKGGSGMNAELMSLERLGQEALKAQAGHFSDLAKSALAAGGSAQGARPKFWALVSNNAQKAILGRVQAQPAGYSPCLVKLAPERSQREEPIIEVACLGLAAECGLLAPRAKLLELGKGLFASAIERFDRKDGKKLHAQTLSALLHHDFRQLSLDWTDAGKALAGLNAPRESTERLFAQACFHVAMSIRDDHSKNLAFLMDGAGAWTLAPAYDLSPCVGPGGWHSMAVAGEARAPGTADLARLATALDLEPSFAHERIERAREVASRLPALCVSMGAAKASGARLSKMLKIAGAGLEPISSASKSMVGGKRA